MAPHYTTSCVIPGSSGEPINFLSGESWRVLHNGFRITPINSYSIHAPETASSQPADTVIHQKGVETHIFRQSFHHFLSSFRPAPTASHLAGEIHRPSTNRPSFHSSIGPFIAIGKFEKKMSKPTPYLTPARVLLPLSSSVLCIPKAGHN